jgi:hypothetical protein
MRREPSFCHKGAGFGKAASPVVGGSFFAGESILVMASLDSPRAGKIHPKNIFARRARGEETIRA